MNQSSNKTYSLKNILEERYLSLLIKKGNIDPEEVNRENTLKEINKLLNVVDAEDIPILETFIDYRKKLLYRILDSILENSKELLHPPGNKRSYLLNQDNEIFINFLLDSYDDNSEDIKNLLDRRFEKLDLDFRELLCRELRDLASNENTSITQDYVERIISLKFELGYNETISKIRDLEGVIDRYALDFYGKEDSSYVYKNVQEIVQMLIDCIPYTMEPNENLPVIDYEKTVEQIAIIKKEAEKRSERVKRGWETRRKNDLK